MDRQRLAAALVGTALLLGAVVPAPILAKDPPQLGKLPQSAEDLKLDKAVRQTDGVRPTVLAASLRNGSGAKQVVIRLKEQPTGAVKGAAKQKTQMGKVKAQQTAFVARAKGAAASFKELGRAQTALNVVVAQVEAASLAKLSRDPAVLKISPVVDYQLDLSETVPYIGGTAVQGMGAKGAGITVAVLDSGIDYTHAALGGPGTKLAYDNAYGTKLKHEKNRKINDAYKGQKLFPTAKVIGGYDFVGELWVGGADSPPLRPDPDPIPCGPGAIKEVCDGSHGTHVADIIAGAKGVAPKATLLAVKVCSSISTACSGVALIQGMDFSLDPNGDGSTADAADIINMSLGSPYGPAPDDDLSAAVQVATDAGTLVVVSAGNSSDKPYIVGSPSSAPAALSVAQTAVPSSTGFAMLISTGGAFVPREAVFQSWSKPLTAVDAKTNVPVQYGDGAGGNLDGCAAFAAGSLTGKVVLVDRGTCTFTTKIANIARGGGAIGVIGLITPGDPFDGSFSAPDCPDNICAQAVGYMVGQSTSTAMKNPAARVTFDPANGIPLVGTVVGSSSRGPSNLQNLAKPEIGAPGASVSAVAGSGTGTASFGGTSGAAPMVAGAAALLQGAFPTRGPLEIKAVLMNTAETDIMNRPEVFGGGMAPITRIGGGEVRVDRAYKSPIAAWVEGDQTAALGLGFQELGDTTTISKTIRVRNYSNQAMTLSLVPSFRFPEDAALGAFSVAGLSNLVVPAKGDATRELRFTIDPAKLPAWVLDSGSNGASGDALTAVELDGYLSLQQGGTEVVHLPWQVLPRAAGDVSLTSGGRALANDGQDATLELYSLMATSPDDPPSSVPGDNLSDADYKAVGVATFAVPANFCSADPSWVYAISSSTWERQSHANAPVLFEYDIDIDRDGTADYAVYNSDAAGLAALSDGRNVTWALNLATGDQEGWFTTDHRTNSGNTVFYVCAEQLGLTMADAGKAVDVAGFAVDFYTSGTVRDVVEFEAVFGGERYFGSVGGEYSVASLPGGATEPFSVFDFGPAGASPDEQGVLIRVADGVGQTESLVIPVEP
jgi:subtilisin family serine protease